MEIRSHLTILKTEMIIVNVCLKFSFLKELCEMMLRKNVPEKKMIIATTSQKFDVEYKKRLSGFRIFSKR
jgi:hypothetical protein